MKRPFLKLDYSRDVETVLTISIDMTMVLEIFGDPDNASYEWCLVRKDGEVEQHSNCGMALAQLPFAMGCAPIMACRNLMLE